jgi:predicted site-specific integrase-resolvase
MWYSYDGVSVMMKPQEMARKLGVSVRTLQRWDNDGKLVAYRNPYNMRYYTDEQYNAYVKDSVKKDRKQIAYARVSNSGQKDDLKNQIDFLRNYANGKGIILDDVIADIGSGLNYKRKNWNKLISEVMNGEIEAIYVTFKDRFVRFGYDWFEQLCKNNNTEIVVLNNPDLSPQQELAEDLISIIHVFSCRIYGLCKYKKQIGGDADVTGVQDGSRINGAAETDIC